MKVWLVVYNNIDGCTYDSCETVSVHASEEGAALAVDRHTAEDDSHLGGKRYTLDEYCSFSIESMDVEP